MQSETCSVSVLVDHLVVHIVHPVGATNIAGSIGMR